MGQMRMPRRCAVAAWDFHGGTDTRAHDFFGAHRAADGSYLFRLFAPEAGTVSLCADFLPDGEAVMRRIDGRGVWEVRVTAAIPLEGMVYHYLADGRALADPYARAGLWQGQFCPSVVAGASGHVWRHDAARPRYTPGEPLSLYHVHLPSFATRNGWSCAVGGAYLDYRTLGDLLSPYAADMGATHLRLMPLCEYADGAAGANGYRPHGYFAPTSRLGSPDGLRAMIDEAHRLGLGVVMDFPFGGVSCPDGADSPDRAETGSLMLSAAMYWMREFHLDGLCLCGVTAPRRETAQTLVAAVRAAFPGALIAAEGELVGALTLQPRFAVDLAAAVCGPAAGRGAVFDRLALTLAQVTGQGDGVILPPPPAIGAGGGYLRTFALRRLMLAYAVAHPGGKQMFMGEELGGSRRWDGSVPPDWFLRELDTHARHRAYVRALWRFYRGERRLWEREDAARFEGDAAAGWAVLTRHDAVGRVLYALFNFTEAPVLCRVTAGEGAVCLRRVFPDGIAPGGDGAGSCGVGAGSCEVGAGSACEVPVRDGVACVPLPPLSAGFWEWV